MNQNHLSRHGSQIDLSDISLVEPENSVIEALDGVLPRNERRWNRRLTREYLRGVFIEDAFVYGIRSFPPLTLHKPA